MFKLLFKLLALPPELLQVHAKGYADLARQAWADHWGVFKNRWVIYALSALCLFLALVFGGVALLLWSALPVMHARHTWVLFALPLGFGVIGIACGLWARHLRMRPILSELQEQIRLDILALKEAQLS